MPEKKVKRAAKRAACAYCGREYKPFKNETVCSIECELAREDVAAIVRLVLSVQSKGIGA